MMKKFLSTFFRILLALALLGYAVLTLSSGNHASAPAGSPVASPASAGAGPETPASGNGAIPAEVTLSFGTFPMEATQLTGLLTAEDIPLLDRFSALQELDASGSTCTEALAAYAAAHPAISVRYDVQTPTGPLSSLETTLKLSNLTHAEAASWAPVLALLPNLQQIDLGSNTDGSRDLTLSDIRTLKDAAPGAEFLYRFTAFDRSISLSDAELNFSHVPMEDNGAAAREILSVMNHCEKLDMDTCGVDSEHMAAIQAEFPETVVIWRVWFGENYTVRTDVEKILASKPSVGGNLTVDNIQEMKYCTRVKYLDIGHNQILNDISVVAYMPDLEVAVLAMVYYDDLSPLAGCSKLEYLEIQSNGEGLTDLSPLSGLTNLEHLNIGNLPGVTDISPLYNLTGLKRLMVTNVTPVPAEQIATLQSIVPDCHIETECTDPTEGHWRFAGDYVDDDQVPHWVMDERYYELTEQFGYFTLSGGYCFPSNDPYLDGTPSAEELAASAAQEEIYRKNRREEYNYSRGVIGLPPYSGTRLPK